MNKDTRRKRKGKIAAGLLGLVCMVLTLAAPMMTLYTHASAGKMILNLSSSSLTEGDNLTVTVTAQNTEGASTTAQMRITYDSGVLEYVGSNAQNAAGAGGEVTATGNSVSFQFKALGAGNSRIIAYGSTEAGDLSAGGVQITVAAAQQTPTEPEEAEENTPADAGQTGENADGNDEEQTVQTAVPEFEIDGVTYEVSSEYGAELTNLGFEQVEVQVGSETAVGLQYPESDWVVLFLVSKEDDTVNGYYLFDEETQTLCPYLGYRTGTKETDDDSELTALQEKNDVLSERYEELEKNNRRMLIGMIVATVVLILILINVLVFRSINRREEIEETDEDEESEDYDEQEAIERQGAYLEATASNSEILEKAGQPETPIPQDDGKRTESEPMTEDDFAAEVAAIMKENKASDADTTGDDSLEIIDLEDL